MVRLRYSQTGCPEVTEFSKLNLNKDTGEFTFAFDDFLRLGKDNVAVLFLEEQEQGSGSFFVSNEILDIYQWLHKNFEEMEENQHVLNYFTFENFKEAFDYILDLRDEL